MHKRQGKTYQRQRTSATKGSAWLSSGSKSKRKEQRTAEEAASIRRAFHEEVERAHAARRVPQVPEWLYAEIQRAGGTRAWLSVNGSASAGASVVVRRKLKRPPDR